MSRSPAQDVVELERTARFIARYQRRSEVAADHLLLAIMGSTDSRWASILIERGVGTYDQAAKVAGPLPRLDALNGLSQERVATERPMRRVLVDYIIGFLLVILRRLRPRAERSPVTPELPFGSDAELVLRVSEELASDSATVGHVLIALASLPGAQIKLLRSDYRVVAAAARLAVGLPRRRDRVILALRRPALECQRRETCLKAGSRRSRLAYLAMRICGVVWAVIVFAVETIATCALYLFLWPALLLMNGIRAAVSAALGVPFTIRRAHEIPGGETDIQPSGGYSDSRAAATMLIPRLICFVICVISMLLLFWQTHRLGVEPFPLTVSHFDILEGHSASDQVLGPLVILIDAITAHGPFLAIGILAGVGAGAFSVPSAREVQLIRLTGGHDVGRGSRLVRVIVAPLVGLTGVCSAVEAILPFKGGAVYLTVYVLPLIFAIAVSILLQALLPY